MAKTGNGGARVMTDTEIAWENQYGRRVENGGSGDAGLGEAPAESEAPRLMLFRLSPKDRQEPPFHFANVAQVMIVAAVSEKQARHIGADADLLGARAWLDDGRTDCAVLVPTEAGLVARDTTGV